MTDWLEDALTPAEERIVSLLFHGVWASEAAKILGISTYTVRLHLVHIYEKFGVDSALDLISLAHRQNAVHLWTYMGGKVETGSEGGIYPTVAGRLGKNPGPRLSKSASMEKAAFVLPRRPRKGTRTYGGRVDPDNVRPGRAY